LSVDDFLKLLLAASIAATFTLAVTWLKASRDDLRAAADYFVNTLMVAADLASSYWLRESNDSATSLEEVRLLGLQQRLSRLRLSAFDRFHDIDRNNLDEDLRDFFDACTGGQFGVKDRPADRNRAREAQAVAARIDAQIRVSVRKASTLGAYVQRLLRRQ